MATVNPPSFLQYGSHSASSDRLTIAALLQPGATAMSSRGGVRMSGDNSGLKVAAQATPNNTVSVAAGTAFVNEADGQGVYVGHNDATITRTISNASTTQNRRDLVVAQVSDQEVSGVSNQWDVVVVNGTSTSGTAVAPAVPSNAIPLAEVSVLAGSTTVIGSSAITDRRVTVCAAGGVLPTVSTSMPANPYGGMAVYCTDTDEVRVWSASASAWRVQSLYPLPAFATAYPAVNSQAITSTSTSFAALPTRQFISFTAAKSMYVLLHMAAWLDATAGTDLRATIGLSGATTGPGLNGTLLISASNNYGDVLQARTGSLVHDSITVPMLLNAGTTTVEAMAYRVNATNACNLNYVVLRVTPLRYA